MKKIFLGGTCNNSTWRDKLIPLLKIDYFNPVVKDWTPECQQKELEERANSDYVLYVITPLMTGVYSIAEVVDDSNKRPEKTLFCVLDRDISGESETIYFNKHQLKSLEAVQIMIVKNGAQVFNSLEEVANYVNGMLSVPFYGEGY